MMKKRNLNPLLAFFLPLILSVSCSKDEKTNYDQVLTESSWRVKNKTFIVNGDTLINEVNVYDADDIHLFLSTGVYLQTLGSKKQSTDVQYRKLWKLSDDGKQLTVSAIDSGKMENKIFAVKELSAKTLIITIETQTEIMAADSSVKVYQGTAITKFGRQ